MYKCTSCANFIEYNSHCGFDGSFTRNDVYLVCSEYRGKDNETNKVLQQKTRDTSSKTS